MKNKNITVINSIEDFPSESVLFELNRGDKLIIYYDKFSSPEKKIKAEEWKEKFLDYSIEIDTVDESISIFKKITKEEVLKNLSFFKKFEAEYRELASSLLLELNKLLLNNRSFEHIDPIMRKKFAKEQILDWNLTFSGSYYFFENKEKEKYIIVPENFGKDTKLDSYCFPKFIEKNREIASILPIKIYLGYKDWERIVNFISE